MDENALVVKELGVERGGRVVLCDVDFVVPVVDELSETSGVLVAVAGGSVEENRAFLRVLAGMQRPVRGSVHLRGQDVYANGQNLKRKLGFVPVGSLVPVSLKVQRAVDYAAELRLSEDDPEVRRARVLEVLELLGLDKVADVRVSRLDAGARFWVMVAVEMLCRPLVLMLEEGIGGGEAGQAEVFWGRLRELSRVEGVSVVCAVGAGMLSKEHLDVVYRLDKGRMSVEWDG